MQRKDLLQFLNWAQTIKRMYSISVIQKLYKAKKQVERSRGSSVSIVSEYGLDGWGLIPDKGKGFFF
jgi:hypothetical protein